MSHYTVSVLHRADQDIDELLAPYDENLEVEPYMVYTREAAIRQAKEHWAAESLAGKTDDEIFNMFSDGYVKDDEQNLYSTYNPDAKWDWYSVGGRWGGSLKLKQDARANYGGSDAVDEARIADIDFSPDEEAYKRALRFWEVAVEGDKQREGEDFLKNLLIILRIWRLLLRLAQRNSGLMSAVRNTNSAMQGRKTIVL